MQAEQDGKGQSKTLEQTREQARKGKVEKKGGRKGKDKGATQFADATREMRTEADRGNAHVYEIDLQKQLFANPTHELEPCKDDDGVDVWITDPQTGRIELNIDPPTGYRRIRRVGRKSNTRILFIGTRSAWMQIIVKQNRHRRKHA